MTESPNDLPLEIQRARPDPAGKPQPLVADIQNFAQDVFDTVREPLIVLDAGLRVRSANSAFYQTFRVSANETESRLIYELGNGQWDIPALRNLLEDIVPRSSVFNDFDDCYGGRMHCGAQRIERGQTRLIRRSRDIRIYSRLLPERENARNA